MIKIKKGLDIPIKGNPEQRIDRLTDPEQIAILGSDYIDMKPSMKVQLDDVVEFGQILFEDKKTGLPFPSPAKGKVLEINRGHKRAFESLVIQRSSSEQIPTFSRYSIPQIESLEGAKVQEQLINTGLWHSMRTRPYSKVADPNHRAQVLFVNAMDTSPFAADPLVVLKGHEEEFEAGLVALSRLEFQKIFLCHEHGKRIPGLRLPQVQAESFSGPHPAGLTGTHIHFLYPVSGKRLAWTIDYQDVIVIGRLFAKGELWMNRIVSLAGPHAKSPRLVEMRLGSSLKGLVEREAKDSHVRVISGNPLHGRRADGPFAYLGRYHRQISLLEEGDKRELLGWTTPGFDKFSVKNVFLSKLLPSKKFNFNTNENGSPRSMVPIGMYESVVPLDVQPTFLLRALASQDTDLAQDLGVLELDEEDLGLCNFVCPGKTDYGPLLRQVLTTIEKEG